MFSTTHTLWTSSLCISSEDMDTSDWSIWDEKISGAISELSSQIEQDFDWRHGQNSDWIHDRNKEVVYARLRRTLGVSRFTAEFAQEFARYQFKSFKYKAPQMDCTGFLKGLFIGEIASWLINQDLNDFIIDFGGDILIFRNRGIIQTNAMISWWNNKSIPIQKDSKFVAVFSSDNTSEKRGHHISSSRVFGAKSSTVIHWFDSNPIDNCIQSDICATQVVANIFCYKPNNTNIFYRKRHRVVNMIKEIR